MGKMEQGFLEFHPSVSFHQCYTLITIDVLLFPQAQMGEAWEPSKKQCYFGNRGAFDIKALSISFFNHWQ